jgi:hypothetical protein
LKDAGFAIITVALDKSADDARAYIEQAAPTHPSLIDTEHVVADLYGMVNVPTGVWIDENGAIVRPPDVLFADDRFKNFHGISSEPYLAAIRAWVRHGTKPMPDEDVRKYQVAPDADQQMARAEFAVAWTLHKRGATAAAELHFRRAGELAPHDWTIRRASMPIRGLDPMGEPFIELYQEWMAAGSPYYKVPRLES